MTAPFVLNEGAAHAWLTELVVVHELAEALGELPAADIEAPPIGMDWNPVKVGEEDTVHILVRAAQHAGLITKPANALLDFEYIDDGDRGRYRWLIDITAPTPLTLCTLSEPWPCSVMSTPRELRRRWRSCGRPSRPLTS